MLSTASFMGTRDFAIEGEFNSRRSELRLHNAGNSQSEIVKIPVTKNTRSLTLVPTTSSGHLGIKSFLLANRGPRLWHCSWEASLPEEIGWLSMFRAALDFDKGEFVSGFLFMTPFLKGFSGFQCYSVTFFVILPFRGCARCILVSQA